MVMERYGCMVLVCNAVGRLVWLRGDKVFLFEQGGTPLSFTIRIASDGVNFATPVKFESSDEHQRFAQLLAAAKDHAAAATTAGGIPAVTIPALVNATREVVVAELEAAMERQLTKEIPGAVGDIITAIGKGQMPATRGGKEPKVPKASKGSKGSKK